MKDTYRTPREQLIMIVNKGQNDNHQIQTKKLFVIPLQCPKPLQPQVQSFLHVKYIFNNFPSLIRIEMPPQWEKSYLEQLFPFNSIIFFFSFCTSIIPTFLVSMFLNAIIFLCLSLRVHTHTPSLFASNNNTEQRL